MNTRKPLLLGLFASTMIWGSFTSVTPQTLVSDYGRHVRQEAHDDPRQAGQ
jgi:hypothetical protein